MVPICPDRIEAFLRVVNSYNSLCAAIDQFFPEDEDGSLEARSFDCALELIRRVFMDTEDSRVVEPSDMTAEELEPCLNESIYGFDDPVSACNFSLSDYNASNFFWRRPADLED